LRGLAEQIVLVAPPSAPANRAWDVNAALAFAQSSELPATIGTNFAAAVADAPLNGGTAIVTGSFHTVGDALHVLQPDWTTAPV